MSASVSTTSFFLAFNYKTLSTYPYYQRLLQENAYLNILDPLREQKRAHTLRNRARVGIDRANDTYARVSRKGGLQHARQLGVAVRNMVGFAL